MYQTIQGEFFCNILIHKPHSSKLFLDMFEHFVVINTFFLFLFHRKMFIGGLSWQTTPGKNNAYLTLQTQRRHKIFISINIWSRMCIMRVYTYVFARSFELDFLRRYFLYKKRIVKWRISFDTLFTY